MARESIIIVLHRFHISWFPDLVLFHLFLLLNIISVFLIDSPVFSLFNPIGKYIRFDLNFFYLSSLFSYSESFDWLFGHIDHVMSCLFFIWYVTIPPCKRSPNGLLFALDDDFELGLDDGNSMDFEIVLGVPNYGLWGALPGHLIYDWKW